MFYMILAIVTLPGVLLILTDSAAMKVTGGVLGACGILFLTLHSRDEAQAAKNLSEKRNRKNDDK